MLRLGRGLSLLWGEMGERREGTLIGPFKRLMAQSRGKGERSAPRLQEKMETTHSVRIASFMRVILVVFFMCGFSPCPHNPEESHQKNPKNKFTCCSAHHSFCTHHAALDPGGGLASVRIVVRPVRCSVFTHRHVHDIRGCLYGKSVKKNYRA